MCVWHRYVCIKEAIFKNVLTECCLMINHFIKLHDMTNTRRVISLLMLST